MLRWHTSPLISLLFCYFVIFLFHILINLILFFLKKIDLLDSVVFIPVKTDLLGNINVKFSFLFFLSLSFPNFLFFFFFSYLRQDFSKIKKETAPFKRFLKEKKKIKLVVEEMLLSEYYGLKGFYFFFLLLF